MAIFITRTAFFVTSAGRFWPWGPLGMVKNRTYLSWGWEMRTKGSYGRRPIRFCT
jgi:hypothetical protein